MGRDALVRLYETMWRDRAYAGDRDQLRQKLAAAYRGAERGGDAERLVRAGDSGAARTDRGPLATSSGSIDEATASALIRGLSVVSPGHPVWFTTMDHGDGSDEYYRALRGLFVQAGWVVRREDRVPFALKPGLFLFAADEHPPAEVNAIQTAFRKAGIDLAFNTGYRSYSQEMKRTRPGWNGIAMSPDQTFALVVGPLRSPVNR
jgi:hypothetical protein